jgi:hypothetical protein
MYENLLSTFDAVVLAQARFLVIDGLGLQDRSILSKVTPSRKGKKELHTDFWIQVYKLYLIQIFMPDLSGH